MTLTELTGQLLALYTEHGDVEVCKDPYEDGFVLRAVKTYDDQPVRAWL